MMCDAAVVPLYLHLYSKYRRKYCVETFILAAILSFAKESTVPTERASKRRTGRRLSSCWPSFAATSAFFWLLSQMKSRSDAELGEHALSSPASSVVASRLRYLWFFGLRFGIHSAASEK